MAALPLPASRDSPPPLFRSLPVIIRFCFHFCCLMLLILLTKALKVVHRTLRCANNKNATGNVAVKYTDATPPFPPCLLRPRVLQKITKILFAALQLLAKKNHWKSRRQRGGGGKAEVEAERRSATKWAWLCGCFSICFTLFTRRTAAREGEGEAGGGRERVAWAQRVQHPFPLKSFISHTMPGTFYRCPLQCPPPSPLLHPLLLLLLL